MSACTCHPFMGNAVPPLGHQVKHYGCNTGCNHSVISRQSGGILGSAKSPTCSKDCAACWWYPAWQKTFAYLAELTFTEQMLLKHLLGGFF